MNPTPFLEFQTLATKVHAGKYRYTSEGYTDASGKVELICPDHGSSFQRVGDHLKGHGCAECGKLKVLKAKQAKGHIHLKVLELAHPNYTFPGYLENFTKVTDKVTVICPTHGEFQMTSHNLKRGKGCRACGHASSAESRRLDLSYFKSKVLGREYTYMDSSYTGWRNKMTMVCSKHGEFQQTPEAHVTKSAGCPACARAANSGLGIIESEEWLSRAEGVHGDSYTYPEPLVGAALLWKVDCPQHGEFQTLGYVHLRGAKCPSCAGVGSEGQREMLAYVQSFCPDAVSDYRFSKEHRQQIDVYVPSLKIGFEYHGLYWHSSAVKESGYHKKKQELAQSEGITLFQIFADEWDKPACKSLIQARLVKQQTIYARKCEVVQLSDTEAQDFYNTYHIQGWKRTGANYALTLAGEVVAIMTFTGVSSHRGQKDQKGSYELARSASSMRVTGGASKLLSHATKVLGIESVVSYSDNRLFSGEMYAALGFTKAHVTQPSYTYISKNAKERVHKSHFRHSKLQKLLGEQYDPALTEKANCEAAGFYQVYDCGLTKWVKQL